MEHRNTTNSNGDQSSGETLAVSIATEKLSWGQGDMSWVTHGINAEEYLEIFRGD